MPEFLELLPPTQALERLLANLPQANPDSEWIASAEAAGRVTAEAVISAESLPAFSRSTVDGYAVRAADTFGASESLPAYLGLIGEVPMGSQAAFSLSRGQTAVIYTGGMLPNGADAVVMVEHTQTAGAGEVEINKAVAANENVLLAGEDVRQGDLVIPRGVRLRPADIGGLMALGILRILVACLPKVAVLSSGDEVIGPEKSPQPGQVRDVNTYSLGALITQAGGIPVPYGIIPDRKEVLQEVVTRAWGECDVVLITAGSSASTRDFTAEVIQKTGQPGVLVHGVSVKPGKPTILAVCGGKPVIGLPGNPVSALVIARLFLVPVLGHLGGETQLRPQAKISARLSLNIASQAGREDWIPVRLVPIGQVYSADPIFYKSNLIFNLAKADGLVRIDADANGLEAGSLVEVWLL